jgi:transcriptional regulator with PAS, ATPase and Fis domain
MAKGARLTPEDLERSSPSLLYESWTLKAAREALEKALIQRTLAKDKGNITRTAVELA